MADDVRHVRYSTTFLKLVHRLTERGVEHARACRLAREAVGIEGDGASDEAIRLEGGRRVGRAAQPKRCGLTR